jgi:hypothetical protein
MSEEGLEIELRSLEFLVQNKKMLSCQHLPSEKAGKFANERVFLECREKHQPAEDEL